MSLQELLDKLEELLNLLEDFEEFRDLWERLKNLRDGVTPEGPADPSELWRLIGDILRKLAEKAPLPPAARKILDTAIKAIEATLESNVRLTLHILCERYFQYRRAGMSHEEAVPLVTSDPLIAQWLLLKWLTGTCADPEEDTHEGEGEGATGGHAEDSSDRPVIFVQRGPPWDSRDDPCCAPPPAGRGGGTVAPTVVFSPPVWNTPPAGTGFNGKILSLTVTVEHMCGAGEGNARVWLRNGGSWIRLRPTYAAKRGGFTLTRRGDWNDTKRTLDMEIYATGEVVIIVTARSRCHTRALQELRLRVP